MKKLLSFLMIVCLLYPCKSFSLADTSRSSIVMDMNSGRILYQKNINEKMLIASTTKIMTFVVAVENGFLDDVVTVGDEVLSMYGTNIYLEVGEEMTLRDLLYGLILRSGNDAAVVIAKHVGGSIENFVDLMNKKAKQLGMTNTKFSNPHGLDDETENYSTAYDMAKLTKYASTLMEFVEISGTKKWKTTSNNKTYIWYNRNKMLNNSYVTGGKTGYTPKAGKTLVSTASKDNLNLIAVTLNDGNHYDTQKHLFDYAFSNYKSTLIIDKDNIDFKNKLYDELYINYNFSYPLKDGEFDKIERHIDLYQIDNYENNQKVGEISVFFDEEKIYSENIYVKKKKEENKSIFDNIIDFFVSLF